jgi:AbiV family abortive infection protein
MTRPDRIIPVAKLIEGLRLLDQNIRDFVKDSQVLLSGNHDSHAVALAIYAFEELGKYSELQRIQDEASKKAESTITVKDELFRSHQYKQTIAKKLVPQDVMILVPAYFDEKYFDPKYFQTKNISVEPHLRSECSFVDWIDNDWRIGIGTTCDAERLRKFLKAVLQTLDVLKAKT